MNWLSLILLLIRLADNLFSWLRSRQDFQAGADAEVAKASASILLKTQAAKDIMAQVTGMSDEQVDKALKKLEP